MRGCCTALELNEVNYMAVMLVITFKRLFSRLVYDRICLHLISAYLFPLIDSFSALNVILNSF